MTRFVVNSGVVLWLLREEIEVPSEQRLLAPTRCCGVGPGGTSDELGWASTCDAQYVALTQLQADAFVTLDAEGSVAARRTGGGSTMTSPRRRREAR